MNTFWHDLQYGLRMLRKSPVFTAVAVLTLALGIGANTAIFSLIDAVLLRTIPVRDPQRLVVFSWRAHHDPKYHGYSNYGDCGSSGGGVGCSFSLPLFQSLHSQASHFSGLSAFAGPMEFNVSGNGPATLARGLLVSGDFFSTLGVNTVVGRPLGPTDDSATAAPAVVLNYAYWQSAFGGKRTAVGKTVLLNTVEAEIVGVAEPSFTNLSPGKTQDFYLPMSLSPRLGVRWFGSDVQSDPQTWWVVMLGRLKPGASLNQAQAQASLIFRNEMLHGAKPLVAESDDPKILLTPAPEGLTGARGHYSTALWVLMCAVGIILLIACANVASLLLARSTARQKEMAVRLAMGAGRGRIARQVLTESLMLSVTGGALGALFAVWSVDAITVLVSGGSDRPFPFVIAPDWRVLAFTLGASLFTGVLFGLAPALRSTRVDVMPALKESATWNPGGAQRTSRWFHPGNALVVAQVALSILVLSGAGLLVRTLHNLHSIDPGFDTRNLLLIGMDPTLSGYKDEQTGGLYQDLRERFEALPGVLSASYSSNALLSGSLWITEIHLDGAPPRSNVRSDMLATGPQFFSALRIPVVAGRTFAAEDFATARATSAAKREARDAAKKSPGKKTAPAASLPAAASRTAAAPVPIVVNQAFARKYLANENPLGKHLGEYEGEEPEIGPRPGYVIVGVVGDTRYNSLRREIHPTMFVPVTRGNAEFEIRTAGDPSALIPAVREVVKRVDPNLPLSDVRTQSRQIEQLLSQERIIARLSTFFGVLALVLACVGLYGLLAFEVARRTREIGIRMALGARPRDVGRMVMRQGFSLAAVGTAIGIGAAFGVTRYLASLLYGVRPFDSVTFAGVAVLLVAVALAACYIPARRATKVDPMVALRYE